MVKDDLFEKSLAPGGAHHQLSQLVGEWEGITRTWFEPGVLADESPARGRIRSLLDGRFVLHEYEGSMQGEPFEGLAIYGFNLGSEKFETAWVDSFHMGTGIMFSQNQVGERAFSALGSYSVQGSESWGWRTQIEIQDPDHIMITAYNIPPGGDEAKAVETAYTRKR